MTGFGIVGGIHSTTNSTSLRRKRKRERERVDTGIVEHMQTSQHTPAFVHISKQFPQEEERW